MEKRYVCFTCYQFHPEMKGVSEEEFHAGDNVCTDKKCVRVGQPLEEAYHCELCDVLYRVGEEHTHTKKAKANTSKSS